LVRCPAAASRAEHREPAPGGHRPAVRGGGGEDGAQHGHGGWRDEGRARALCEARREQCPDVGGERGGGRGGGEEDKARGEGAPPAVAVGEASAEEHQPGEGQSVGGAKQDQVGALQVEFAPDAGQRYGDRGEREDQRGLDAAEEDEGASVPHGGDAGGACGGHVSP
jgi:hypothetical protein